MAAADAARLSTGAAWLLEHTRDAALVRTTGAAENQAAAALQYLGQTA